MYQEIPISLDWFYLLHAQEILKETDFSPRCDRDLNQANVLQAFLPADLLILFHQKARLLYFCLQCLSSKDELAFQGMTINIPSLHKHLRHLVLPKLFSLLSLPSVCRQIPST